MLVFITRTVISLVKIALSAVVYFSICFCNQCNTSILQYKRRKKLPFLGDTIMCLNFWSSAEKISLEELEKLKPPKRYVAHHLKRHSQLMFYGTFLLSVAYNYLLKAWKLFFSTTTWVLPCQLLGPGHWELQGIKQPLSYTPQGPSHWKLWGISLYLYLWNW